MIDPSASIHAQALIEPHVTIGARTRVWAFAHILPEVEIGSDCNICDHTLIENQVRLGNRVTIKSGVYLWTGVIVSDDVFIGPCVAFTNDKFPRSRRYLAEVLETKLLDGCSIGANATILPGITIGAWALVGAGSVVTKNVPNYAKVYGNPAQVHGWVCRCGETLQIIAQEATCACQRHYYLDDNTNELREKVNEYSKL